MGWLCPLCERCDSYLYVERARPPPEGTDVFQPHGGICVFYRMGLSASVKAVTSSDTFEQLATIFTSSNEHFLVVAVYRPGTKPPNDQFHVEFSDFLDAELPIQLQGIHSRRYEYPP